MSERGTFVTERIYCEKCLAAVKSVLCRPPNKYLLGMQLTFLRHDFPIIAGAIGGTSIGEELREFEEYLIPEIEEKICHKVRIAVLSDSAGERVFTAVPAIPAGGVV